MSSEAVYAIGENPIGTDQVDAWAAGSLYFVLINGTLQGKIQMNSVSITDDADGSSSCSCTALNPSIVPVSGNTLSVVFQDEVIFAGIVRLVTLTSGPEEAVKTYAIEAGGWELLLQRRSVTKSYANITVGNCIRDALTTGQVRADGVVEGVVDDGPQLVLVNADHVRVWDFIRDIGAAGGGVCFINPYKQVIYSLVATPWAGVQLGVNDALDISVAVNFDNYRNQMVVTCTSLDGSTSQTSMRTNGVEVAARIAAEGGSGIYEVYQAIQHPTSNVPADLVTYAQSVAYISLLIYGKAQTTVTLRTRNATLLRIGQFVRCNFPGMGIVGTYVVIRRQIQEVFPELQFTVDLVDSTVQQVAIQSLLRIVGAAQAAIAILANLFPNSINWNTAQTTTWTVPAGVTNITITVLGGSGGGGGGLWIPPGYGGNGGNGGFAMTIKAVTAGNVFDVVVGNGGACGHNESDYWFNDATVGFDGANSSVSLSGVVACQGNAGLAGGRGNLDPPNVYGIDGAKGADGSGIGDTVVVGGGPVGGIGGLGEERYHNDAGYRKPTVGLPGSIEIRW